MYTILIILVLIKDPTKIMQAKSIPYETIELCEQNAKLLLQFRDKGGIVDGMNIKNAFCVKEK